jgi:hypothetical protein
MTNTKYTWHKTCHCKMCNMMRTHEHRNYNERKLRRRTKIALRTMDLEDISFGPITSPYVA